MENWVDADPSQRVIYNSDIFDKLKPLPWVSTWDIIGGFQPPPAPNGVRTLVRIGKKTN